MTATKSSRDCVTFVGGACCAVSTASVRCERCFVQRTVMAWCLRIGMMRSVNQALKDVMIIDEMACCRYSDWPSNICSVENCWKRSLSSTLNLGTMAGGPRNGETASAVRSPTDSDAISPEPG